MFLDIRGVRVTANPSPPTFSKSLEVPTVRASFTRWPLFRHNTAVVVPQDKNNVKDVRGATVSARGLVPTIETEPVTLSYAKVGYRFGQFGFGADLNIPQPVKARFMFARFAVPAEVEVPTAVDGSFMFRQFTHYTKINIPPIEVIDRTMFRQFVAGAAIEVPTAVYNRTMFQQVQFGAAVQQRPKLDAGFVFRQFEHNMEIEISEFRSTLETSVMFGQFTQTVNITVGELPVRRRRITTVVR